MGCEPAFPVHVKLNEKTPSSFAFAPSTTIQYVPGSTMSYSKMEQKKSLVSLATNRDPGEEGQPSYKRKVVSIAVLL